jgi:uncharacterized repeat protein (TIGR03803 family)
MHTFVSIALARAARLIVPMAVLALAGTAQTPSLTTLYSFAGGASGASPTAGVIFGPNGSLFGTTPDAGIYPGSHIACQNSHGCGTVFELTPGTPWTENVIWSFQSGTDTTDGANPGAGLTLGKKGVFYGTTFAGGSSGNGTVFQLTPPTETGGAWTETVLYSFAAGPAIGLVNVNESTVTLVSGTPFVTGTTWNGVSIDIMGSILTVASVQSSTELTLTTPFQNPVNGVGYLVDSAPAGPWAGWPDGSGPEGGVILLPSGKLYGTTSGGGSAGAGAVFQLTPPAGGTGPWTEEVIANIGGGALGNGPQTGLVAVKGSLFGTTCCGQVGGTVFELSPAGGGAWKKPVVLYSFTKYDVGDGPFGGLAIDANGVLYGTTTAGGPGGAGIVFSLTPTKGKYTLTTIQAFSNAGASGLVNVNGNQVSTTTPAVTGSPFVTGTAWNGAPININGTVYTIASVSSASLLTLTTSAGTQTKVSYSVQAQPGDGGSPYGTVTLGSSGQLYVTVTSGCAYGVGGVIEFTPPAAQGDPWTETILYSFMGGTDGSQPFAGVTLNKGSLYGTTVFDGASGYGTVFELTP